MKKRLTVQRPLHPEQSQALNEHQTANELNRLNRLFVLSRAVTHLLEEAPLHLFGGEVGVNTGKHVAVQGPRTMPDMTKEEEQRKHRVRIGEPAPGTRPENPVRTQGFAIELERLT